MTSSNQSTGKFRYGFTLVELLVVISIMAILVALTIPQLRMLSRDRGARESARVVGSLIASTSQNAVVDGAAGIMIVRNQNMINPDPNNTAPRIDPPNQLNSATSLYRMRAIPDYTGLSDSDVATGGAGGTVSIPSPPSNIRIQRGDVIYLGDRNIGYRIGAVSGATLTIQTSANTAESSMVPPNFPPAGLSFRIKLRPRVVESSRIDLPAGYIVDLRYTGIAIDINDVDPGSAAHMCSDGTVVVDGFGNVTSEDPIILTFDSTGSLDRVYGLNLYPEGAIPVGGFFLFVSEDALANADPVSSDNSLWVNVNGPGTTSVTSNVAQPVGAPLETRIQAARAIANTRQSATQ